MQNESSVKIEKIWYIYLIFTKNLLVRKLFQIIANYVLDSILYV